jgi:hypothetical protein
MTLKGAENERHTGADADNQECRSRIPEAGDHRRGFAVAQDRYEEILITDKERNKMMQTNYSSGPAALFHAAATGPKMITITDTRELPWHNVRGFLVEDVDEARRIAAGRDAWLFQQTAEALYVFVRMESETK